MGFLVLAHIINVVSNVLCLLMLGRAVLSWVVRYSRYNSTLNRVFEIVTSITEPIIAPVRRLLSRFVNTGPLDLAPLVAFFIIVIISRILTSILIALS